MSAKILPSSQGPVVIYEGLILHMTDIEGLIAAVDDTPNLLQDLEKSILEHLTMVLEFVKGNLLDKKQLHIRLASNALSTLDDFNKFANTEYIGYIHARTQQNNPEMTREQVEKETRRLNREDINDYYAIKKK